MEVEACFRGFSLVLLDKIDMFAHNFCALVVAVNPDTIYKWIERKKLPAHKMGRLWRFMASEVDDWVTAGKAGSERTDEKRVIKSRGPNPCR